jgi:hypothetical protein
VSSPGSYERRDRCWLARGRLRVEESFFLYLYDTWKGVIVVSSIVKDLKDVFRWDCPALMLSPGAGRIINSSWFV